jgi:hypothetical protein
LRHSGPPDEEATAAEETLIRRLRRFHRLREEKKREVKRNKEGHIEAKQTEAVKKANGRCPDSAAYLFQLLVFGYAVSNLRESAKSADNGRF